MADPEATSRPSPSPEESLSQILPLLRSKNPTQIFVGLTLLHTLLRTHPQLTESRATLLQCWKAIPTKFLIKLLKSKPSDKRTAEEASQLQTLAISIMEAFISFLGAELLWNEGEGDGTENQQAATLAPALLSTIPDLQDPAVQVSALESMGAMLGTLRTLPPSRLSPMINLALSNTLPSTAAQSLLTQILTGHFSTGNDVSAGDLSGQFVQALLLQTTKEHRATIFTMIGNALAQSSNTEQPEWLWTLIHRYQACFLETPTQGLFRAGVDIFAHFNQIVDRFDPWFNCMPTPVSMLSKGEEPKPFSYLFTKYILIDIKSTVPMLMENLAKPEYSEIAVRLSKSFDLLGSWVGVVLALGDEDDEDEDEEWETTQEKNQLNISPSQLLELRKETTETLSSVIEFLRDRWDAARSGTMGLDPSAIPNPSTASFFTMEPLHLTYDHPTISLETDPIILSSTRLLSLYLHEDDSDRLCTEALGIMDVVLDLYKHHTQSTNSNSNYIEALSLIFPPLLSTTDGIDTFVAQGGWDVLIADVIPNLPYPSVKKQEEVEISTSDTIASPTATWTDFPPRMLTLLRTLTLVAQLDANAQKWSWSEKIRHLAASASSLTKKGVKDMTDLERQRAYLLLEAEAGLAAILWEYITPMRSKLRVGLAVGRFLEVVDEFMFDDKMEQGVRDGLMDSKESFNKCVDE